MTIASDYFAMFKLPVNYAIDLTGLAERYRILQRAFHPDRYANRSEQEKRLAVQATADLNQAYVVLRSPLARAQYLLQLKGVADRRDTSTVNDPELLLEQMELRERLDAIRNSTNPVEALADLEKEVKCRYVRQQEAFAQAFQVEELSKAATAVTEMQFHAKLLRELRDVAETLDDKRLN